jgi:maltoporin
LRSALALGLLLGSVSVAQAQPAPPAPTPTPAPTPAPGEPAPPPDGTPPPTEPPAPEPAAAELSPKQVEQVKKEIASAPKRLESTGYLRAGLGINSRGGKQVAFQAPGAYTKYRLGNETETYGELGFDINWMNPDKSATWFKTSLMLAVVAPLNNTFDVLSAIAVRQAYAEAGRFWNDKPDLSVWAGQRFYRRKDVHITDFFHHDMSSYGAGFQDWKVGKKAKLAVAYLAASTGGATGDLGDLLRSTLDIRLYDIPVGKGTLEFWLIPTYTRDGSLIEPSRGGIGGGVFHFMPMKGGFNELSAEFGYGHAAGLNPFLDRGIAKDGTMFRIVERATLQLDPKLSIMWTGVLQLDNKNGSDSDANNPARGNLWFSAGARPIYMLGKYTGVAVEGGVDIVQPEGDMAETGFLGKLTVAPMIRPGGDFWARPEIRAFVTAAFWNDPIALDSMNPMKQGVGGPAYVDKTFGLTAGVQMESWW